MRALGLVLLAGCSASAAPQQDPIDKKIGALAAARLAPAPALDKAIATFYGGRPARRPYTQPDKPLYQPGETVWFRADVRAAKTLVGGPPMGVTLQLISPRDAIVATDRKSTRLNS